MEQNHASASSEFSEKIAEISDGLGFVSLGMSFAYYGTRRSIAVTLELP